MDQEPAAQKPRGSRVMALLAVGLVVFGGVSLYRAASDQRVPPPQPPAAATRPLPDAGGPPPQMPIMVPMPAPPPPLTMPASTPVGVAIPRIHLDASIVPMGLNSDGSLGVPSERDAKQAAWYDGGPTPGELGPAVIDAHVDSWYLRLGQAAFYSLGAARPGDTVEVTRADHRTAVFTTDSVETVAKDDFPTDKVYGPLPYAGLRLITCGGGWTKRGGYAGNVVLYAHLTSVK